MDPTVIAAIATAATAIIGAITSLIVAVRSSNRSSATAGTLAAHLESGRAAAAVRRDRALTVPCATCGALPGNRCAGANGPTNLVHSTRVVAWQQANTEPA